MDSFALLKLGERNRSDKIARAQDFHPVIKETYFDFPALIVIIPMSYCVNSS